MHEPLVELERLAFEDPLHQSEHAALGQILAGFPAVERIGVVRHQEGKLLVAAFDLYLDRRRKAARNRSNRPVTHSLERECLLRLGELEGASRAGDVLAVRAQQPDSNGNRQRQWLGLSGEGALRLRESERVYAPLIRPTPRARERRECPPASTTDRAG